MRIDDRWESQTDGIRARDLRRDALVRLREAVSRTRAQADTPADTQADRLAADACVVRNGCFDHA
ncbi:hypothetical protein BKK81_22595 [Cupriavidus sp. USMAHM13]|nr:hypothetical protein BKK81_22595 [Cupriavidus sp. USMAHM13]